MLRFLLFWFVLHAGLASAQCIVTGRILDNQKNAVEGVLVLDKTSNKRTHTDTAGIFKLEISCRGTTVSLQHPSYPKQDIEIFSGSLNLGDINLSEIVIDTVEVRPDMLPVPTVPKIEPRL
ncbi:MAG TPA: hypothetical protein VD905_16300, partial [Flavobacteriales bacterium]|nr:hypothetical protein [Flavobacteriales bacterium]